MTQLLTRFGDAFTVEIDRSLMERLGIHPEMPLDVTVEGGRIVLTPIRDQADPKKLVRDAAGWVNENYSEALKKLAE